MPQKAAKTETIAESKDCLFTYVTLAERWDASARTIKRLVREGKLKVLRLDSQLVRIRLSEILRYESEALTTGPSPRQMNLAEKMHNATGKHRAKEGA